MELSELHWYYNGVRPVKQPIVYVRIVTVQIVIAPLVNPMKR
jgi:hypothetical protein